MNHFYAHTATLHAHGSIHRELTRGLASCQNHSATTDAKLAFPQAECVRARKVGG